MRHFAPRFATRLAVATSIVALVLAPHPLAEDDLPPPILARLLPAGLTLEGAAADSGQDPWAVLDRDLQTGVEVDGTSAIRMRAQLDRDGWPAAWRLRGLGEGWLTVRVERADGELDLVPGLDSVPLALRQEAWVTVRAREPLLGDAFVLDWIPTGSGGEVNVLSEVEIWSRVPAPVVEDRQGSVMDRPDAVVAPAMPSFVSLATPGTASPDPLAATSHRVAFRVSVPPAQIARAFLVYELSGRPHWLSVPRSINGRPLRGGLELTTPDLGPRQAEELNPAWLERGVNWVEFRLPPNGGTCTLEGIRLVLVPERGVLGPNAPLTPTLGTTIDLAGGEPIEVAVAVGDQNVQQVLLDGVAADGSRARLVGPLEFAAHDPGWQVIALDEPPHQLTQVLVGTDVDPDGLRDVRVSASPPLGAPEPQLHLSVPSAGEYFGEHVVIRGFLRGEPSEFVGLNVTLDGLPVTSAVAADGSFELSVPREPVTRNGERLAAERLLVVRLADGRELEARIPLQRDLARTARGFRSSARRGHAAAGTPPRMPQDLTVPIPDWGAPFAELVTPGAGARTLAFGGAELELPNDALGEETEISIRPLSADELPVLEGAMDNVTPQRGGFRFGPHGQRFRNPYVIRVPYDEALLPPGMVVADIRTFYMDEATGRWVPLHRVAIDRNRRLIVSRCDHFTDMINATLAIPEHSTPSQFNATSIKDLEVSDPGEEIDLIEAPTARSDGTAVLTHPVKLPPGRLGMQPDVSLSYSSAGGNGWLGWGWSWQPPSITVDTRFGVPRYDDTTETETYLLNGQMLAPRADRLAPEPRVADRVFTMRVEGSFQRIIRQGTDPSSYRWEITDKNGTRQLYGTDASGRLSDPTGTGHVYQWFLQRVIDTHGNTIEYHYAHDNVPTAEPGVQVYVDRIEYTGNPGLGLLPGYSVHFVRDAGVRLDQVVSGRPGFKTATRHLLDAIEVRRGSNLVRRYELEYGTGDYDKTLLQAIAVKGRDGSTEFQRHAFEYFTAPRDGADYDGFGAPEAISSLDASDGFTRSESTSEGGSHLLAFGTSCDPHEGDGKGDSKGTDRTIATVSDVNGDGLTDRLRMNGDWDRGNLLANTTPEFAGGSFPGTRLLGLGQNETASHQHAFHSAATGSASEEYSYTNAQDLRTLTDINGDGFPDIVSVENSGSGEMEVWLNDGLGFGSGSAHSGWSMSGLDFFDPEVEADLHDDFGSKDTVLVWTAPRAGSVALTGGVQRLNAGTGLITAQVHGTSPSVPDTVMAGSDTAPHPISWSGSVAAGDRLVFLVHAEQAATQTAVRWSPRIEYAGADTGLLEAYGRPANAFNVEDDFRLAGPGAVGWQVPVDGDITVQGAYTKEDTADDLRLRILLDGVPAGPGCELALSHDLTASAPVDFACSFAVVAGQSVSAEVASDSPIDPDQVDWSPVAEYDSYCLAPGDCHAPSCPLPLEPGETCTVDGRDVPRRNVQSRLTPSRPAFVFEPPVAPTEAYQTAPPRTLDVSWDVQKTGSQGVRLLVQGVHERHAVRQLSSADTGSFEVIDDSVSVPAGGQLSCTALVWGSDLAGLDVGVCTVDDGGGPADLPVNVRRIGEGPPGYSGGFHAWHYGERDGDSPFSMSELDMPSASRTSLVTALDEGLPARPQPLWAGVGRTTYLAAGEFRPATDRVDVAEFLNGSGIELIRRSRSQSKVVGMSSYGGGESRTTGWTKGQLDLFDLNGDRFPDQVSDDGVRFNDGVSGFSGMQVVDGRYDNLRYNENESVSRSHGASIPVLKVNARGRPTGVTMPSSKSQGETYAISRGIVDHLDVNGDGLPDHVRLDGGGALRVRLNLGYRFGAEESWSLPGWTVGDLSHDSAVSGDPNALRVQETVGTSSSSGGMLLIFTTGEGESMSVTRGLSDFLDINGDGLLDHVMKRDEDDFYRVKLNRGASFGPEVRFTTTAWPDLPAGWASSLGGGNDTLTASETIGSDSQLAFEECYQLSPTFAATIEASVMSQENHSWFELGLQDVDGDGKPDATLKRDGDGDISAKLNKAGKANMLRRVERPLGGSIELDYARQGNVVDLTAVPKVDMPANQWVLASVTLDSGLPDTGFGEVRYTTTLEYFNSGYHDRAEREDYGFGHVRETRPDGAHVDRWFHNQDYYRKGLPIKTVTSRASGLLWEKESHRYELRPVGPGSFFPAQMETARALYEASTTDEDSPCKSTAELFDYDGRGNVTWFQDRGDDGIEDDAFGTITYHEDPAAHVYKPETLLVRDYRGRMLRRRHATYTPATADLETLALTVTGGKDPATGAPRVGDLAVYEMTWTDEGNLESFGYPNGYTLTYEYDVGLRTHVRVIADNFGYSSTTEYDLDWGKPTDVLDVNSELTSRRYDQFGRLVEVRSPYEQSTPVPTIAAEHHPEAARPYAITRHYDEGNPSDTIDTITFIDGLRRVVQTKKDLERDDGTGFDGTAGFTVSGRIEFDLLGRVSAQGQPRFATGAASNFVDAPILRPTLFEHDERGRKTLIDPPDASSTVMVYQCGELDGRDLLEAITTDANTKSRHVYTDVMDRQIAVKEFNTIDGVPQTLITHYEYNPLSELTAVIDADGNRTTAEYDTVGQRVMLDSPDAGRVEWWFDLSGNVGAKETPNLRAAGQVIRYHHQFNRLIRIEYPETTDVTYVYGPPGALEGRAGRIWKVQDESGVDVRSYGRLGELTRCEKTFTSRTGPRAPVGANGETYITDFRYDAFNRLRELVYPDGEVLTFAYDPGGLLDRITGVKEAVEYVYLDHQGYDEYEQRLRTVYGNGVVSTYDYDPLMRRLDTLQSVGAEGRFQNLKYGYDLVGNIETLENQIPVGHPSDMGGPTEQAFGYDDLYQLVSATGEYRDAPNKRNVYSLQMRYDRIGNIRQKTQAHAVVQPSGTVIPQQATSYDWTYSYGSPRPHAATRVGPAAPVGPEAGRTFSFDGDGNQTGWENERDGTRRTIDWTEEDRIRSISDSGKTTEFRYDSEGVRTHKIGEQGETIYVNQWFTIRNDAVISKHVFAGQSRISTKLGRPAFNAVLGRGRWTEHANDGGRGHHRGGGNSGNGEGNEEDGSGRGRGRTERPAEDLQYFYHADHLGSSNYITDGSAELFEHLEYFPFGELWVRESSNTERTPYLFTGQELDQETGLLAFGVRYLDPRLSTWCSVDPLLAEYMGGVPSGGVYEVANLNVYALSWQKPLVFKDADGAFVNVLVGAVIGAAVGAAAYVLTTDAEKRTGRGFWGAVAGGTITGAAAGLTFGGSAVVVGTATFTASEVAVVGSIAASATQQAITTGEVNAGTVMLDAALSVPGSNFEPSLKYSKHPVGQLSGELVVGGAIDAGSKELLSRMPAYEPARSDSGADASPYSFTPLSPQELWQRVQSTWTELGAELSP